MTGSPKAGNHEVRRTVAVENPGKEKEHFKGNGKDGQNGAHVASEQESRGLDTRLDVVSAILASIDGIVEDGPAGDVHVLNKNVPRCCEPRTR